MSLTSTVAEYLIRRVLYRNGSDMNSVSIKAISTTVYARRFYSSWRNYSEISNNDTLSDRIRPAGGEEGLLG